MAAVSPPYRGNLPLGAPPSGDSPGPTNINRNERTMPEWLDRAGMFGQRIILSLTAANNGKLPKNPFVIAKSIELVCGQIESANTEERGSKYVLKTRNAEQAKKLIQITELIDGTAVVVTSHPTLNLSRCVVSCREVIDMTEKELEGELKEQGVTAVRRITRLEGELRVNTPTLVLTINGTTTPKHIMFGLLRIPTRLFYPSPMICYNCCSYGHTKMKCESATVCRNCSGNHPTNEESCNLATFCKNCKGDHSPVSRKCPVYAKEEQIIKIKVETGVSFAEARKEFSKRNGETSYASVVGAQSRLDRIQSDNEKDREIAKLREELSKMRRVAEELSKLKESLKKAAEEHEISESDEPCPMSDEEALQNTAEKTHKRPKTASDNETKTDEENTQETKKKKKHEQHEKRSKSYGDQDTASRSDSEEANRNTHTETSVGKIEDTPKPKRGRPRKQQK